MIIDTLDIIAVDSPSWMMDALCANGDYDPDDWYPECGESGYSEKAARAIKVCKACPVMSKCLRWAYEKNDTWAVLGGMTAKQRSRVRTRIMRKRDEWRRKLQGDRAVRV